MASATDREYLARRAAFQKLAGEMYDRMFGKDEQHQLVTFTQREDRALELGEKLQTYLLEEHLTLDPWVHQHNCEGPRKERDSSLR